MGTVGDGFFLKRAGSRLQQGMAIVGSRYPASNFRIRFYPVEMVF
jgi:hypothetical protein